MDLLSRLDISLLYLINGTLNISALDPLMVFITNKSYIIAIPFLALMLSKERKDALLAIAVGICAALFSDWVANMAKHAVGRPRPFYVLEAVNVLVGRGKSFSMPSNHAVNSFAFAVPFYFFVKSRAKHFVLALAFLVAYSRVYVGVHYPSDVVAGALIGSALAGLLVFYYSSVRKLRPEHSFLIIFLTVISLFRLYYVMQGPLDLSPDEAHYWEWSRRLDISYYSKGPVIAYLIWSGTHIFGDNPLGVRFLAVFISLLSSLVLYLLGRRLYDEKTGVYAAALMQVVPLFAAYGVGMTIDSPLILFWTLSLLLFHVAISKDSLPAWLLLGLFIGLGLMTKYLMAFFYLSAFIYLIASGEKRKLLLRPGPYIAFLLSLIVFSPVFVWNFENGWVTFRHTLGQAHAAEGLKLSPKSFFDFIGSQLGVVTPVLLALMLYALIKKKKEDSFSFWFSAPVLLFFLLKSAQGKVQANWALVGYISGVISFSAFFLRNYQGSGKGKKALVSSALALSVFVAAVGHYPSILRLSPKTDPTSRFRGWDGLGKEVGAIRAGLRGPVFIFSDSYQVASELAFYVDGNPRTYCANFGRRMNQYDLWPGFYDLVGYGAIFVKIGDSDIPDGLKAAFSESEKQLFRAKDRRGRDVRDYSIFVLRGFKGMKETGPAYY